MTLCVSRTLDASTALTFSVSARMRGSKRTIAWRIAFSRTDVELGGELARERRQAEVENALAEQRIDLGVAAERLHRVEERAEVA
jgi:hypothetical protein